MSTSLAYIALSLCTIAIDFAIAIKAFRKKDENGKWLGLTLLAAAIVALMYSGSIIAPSYFFMSLFSSLYFVGIDLMAAAILVYTCKYMEIRLNGFLRVLFYCALGYMLFDIVILMANPFQEIALGYIYNASAFIHWRYDPYPLYQAHLILCYFLIAASFGNFFYKVIRVPRMYRGRYTITIVVLIAVVAMNAAFLFLQEKGLPDFSVLFYSAAGIVLYLNTYRFADKNLLSRAREVVIDKFGQPVILFDYAGHYITSNEEAGFLLPEGKLTSKYKLSHFLSRNGFHSALEHEEKDISFHYRVNADSGMRSYRCDFRPIKDNKGTIVGRLFVLTDNSLEFDLLTGFETQNIFERSVLKELDNICYPVGIASVDLNHLSYINSTFGREMGDKAIQVLAHALQKYFPKDSKFVRLDDAELLVVCERHNALQMREFLEKVETYLTTRDIGCGPLAIQSAVSVATVTEPNIIKAVQDASSSMRARKLLDPESAHSSLLDSFVQTQRESDGETESHVQRTRQMGECLGRRLGFSDKQLSSLALLCLLHDIGKVGVPLEILNKPGKLTDAEWEVMKSHTEKGYRIASASPELLEIADLILHHHESWDGHGYPDGLRGETIPLLSRAISIVDTYDAMTHDRPYRSAMTPEEAKEELRRCAGTQFDPNMVSEFLQMLKEHPELDVSEEESKKHSEQSAKIPYVGPRSLEGEIDTEYNQDSFSVPVRYSRYRTNDVDQIIEVDDEFENITGYSKQDVKDYGLTHTDLIVIEDREDYFKSVGQQIMQSGMACMEHRLRRKDTTIRYVMCIGRQYYDSATRTAGSEIVITDLSNSASMHFALERERASVKRSSVLLEDSVRKDRLVGILNREAFRSDVQNKLLDGTTQVVLIMMDLDKFKEYNDTYGHPQGDVLLVHVGQALEDSVAQYGVACRFGGDEFGAALFFDKDVSRSTIATKVENVYNDLVAYLVAFDDRVTVSMGAAMSSDDYPTFSSLYDKSDKKLYEAKEQGRNCLRYEL